jgi:tetratricopeptide (TPR) repeat protein
MLKKQPELAKDPEFIKKYTQVQARELYFSGRILVDQGDYQQAIASFEKSLTLNPEPAEVNEMLAKTRTQAVQDCHARAVKAAAGGDLARAQQWIDKGLIYDPASAEMLKDRKSLAATADPGVDAQAWRSAVDLEKAGRLCGALRKCEEALTANPQHLAALAAGFRLRPQIVQARQKVTPVNRLIAKGDLEEAGLALAAIEGTCADLPELAIAKAALAKAKDSREQVWRDIDALAAAGRWEEALAKVKEAKAQTVDGSQLNKKAQELRKLAAESHKAAAIRLLKEQRYVEAKTQLRQGTAFVSETEARDLWQQFWIEGGGILDRKGHAGAAYLWYTQGMSLKADPEIQQLLNDLTAIITRQFSYRLDASVTIADPRLQIESDLMKQAIATGLQKLPDTWAIVAANPATATQRANLQIAVSDIRMDSEPRFFRKASQVRNYTKTDGERGRWEYTVEEYRKSGDVRYAVKLSQGARDLVQSAPLTWNWYVADQIIDRPNPALGLRDSVLNLPANDDFRNQLLERFISIQLNNAVSTLFETLIASLETEAGKKEDLESYLDLRGAAYLLLLSTDPKRAATVLQDALKF